MSTSTIPSSTGTGEPLTTAEVVKLCAINNEMFGRIFFARAIRQTSPAFHKTFDAYLEDRSRRLVSIQAFRGSAKTTKGRIFTAKRVAYGRMHTGLYVSKSEPHAIRSLRWIKRQIEYNTLFTSTFNLRKGDKWQDTEIEIYHGTDEYPIWLTAAGVGGSLRGINFDDYRPDFILLDDPLDSENTGSAEQRKKTNEIILADLKESLAPRSESPDAKLVMIQTPINQEDASNATEFDAEWSFFRQGCWTHETEDLELHERQSAWESRFPSEELRHEKRLALSRNQVHLFNREKECRVTSPDTADFLPTWLNFYDLEPEGMVVCIAIDPVPPPSDKQVKKGLAKKDFEAFAVVGKYKGKFFILETRQMKGHDPSWTIATFFELCIKYKPTLVIVEAVAYQRVLSWILKTAMQVRRIYYAIKEYTDPRSKRDRIVQALNGPASQGMLYVKANQTEFISQFKQYPDVAHEDILEAVAICVEELNTGDLAGDWATIEEEEDDIPRLEYAPGAP